MKTVTRDDMLELLDYDPITGDLRWKRRGEDLIAIKRIRNTWNSAFAGEIAGASDMETGRMRIMVKGKCLHAKRIVYAIMTGDLPKSPVVHINGNESDLSWKNIALKSDLSDTQKKSAEQLKIDLKAFKKSTASKVYPGVTYDAYSNEWRSVINISFIAIIVGMFRTAAEAIDARSDEITRMGIAL